MNVSIETVLAAWQRKADLIGQPKGFKTCIIDSQNK